MLTSLALSQSIHDEVSQNRTVHSVGDTLYPSPPRHLNPSVHPVGAWWRSTARTWVASRRQLRWTDWRHPIRRSMLSDDGDGSGEDDDEMNTGDGDVVIDDYTREVLKNLEVKNQDASK